MSDEFIKARDEESQKPENRFTEGDLGFKYGANWAYEWLVKSPDESIALILDQRRQIQEHKQKADKLAEALDEINSFKFNLDVPIFAQLYGLKSIADKALKEYRGNK